MMISDSQQCVDCQRCVCICPTGALKIVDNPNKFRNNSNWSQQIMTEVYKQAETGGVLLSAMGNPKEYPVYWDKILLNASQVTNPPIDPLREPMETKVFLGKKPKNVSFNEDGSVKTETSPTLELSTPIMFSAMSYGSISRNAHESLARAATELGIFYNTGEGGLHKDFYQYGPNTIVQVASGRFGASLHLCSDGTVRSWLPASRNQCFSLFLLLHMHKYTISTCDNQPYFHSSLPTAHFCQF